MCMGVHAGRFYFLRDKVIIRCVWRAGSEINTLRSRGYIYKALRDNLWREVG